MENKIQSFSTSDYSVSENGNEKTYTIHSDELKWKLWNEYLKDNHWREANTIQEFQVVIEEKGVSGYSIFSNDGVKISSTASPHFGKFNREFNRERERYQLSTNGIEN
ncbi:hypothetical protein [endosymbiont GvMRE of Glomus versiforme]|uniref:hypothetical protein n=1 Tax=endosymbiont GvMRE of Glomus versiforme TaxID=2039283 RepID=UPI0011C34334|nr:hypothetical protein [endosymbiont GvMRE of Glomus versiforme]